MAHAHQLCPDNGTCHHMCEGMCFRVINCGPLSGVYPGDRWPALVVREWGLEGLTPRPRSVLGESMSDTIPHPSTRYFMGWEHTIEHMHERDTKAEADGVFLVWPVHIWPLMGYLEADARWKQGQTTEIELYALCGMRLRSYRFRPDGTPIEMDWHWADGASNHNPGGISYDDQQEMCTDCMLKWTEAAE